MSLFEYTEDGESGERERYESKLQGKYKGYGVYFHPVFKFSVTCMSQPSLLNYRKAKDGSLRVIRLNNIDDVRGFIDDLPPSPSLRELLTGDR